MNAVKSKIQSMVDVELNKANDNFPLFNSTHEGFAIVAEEVDEAIDEMKYVMLARKQLWNCVKRNAPLDVQLAVIDYIRRHSEALAAEAVQIAAMCKKYKQSMKAKENADEL